MDLQSCTDDDLIQRVRAGDDVGARDELVRRSIPLMRATIRGMVLGKRSVCPPSEDRTAFLEDALSCACAKLLRAIHRFHSDADKLERWLPKVAKSAMLDHRRSIVRHTPPIALPIESENGEQARDLERALPLRFRSRHWSDPTVTLRKKEIGELLTTLLERHAQDNEDSAFAIRMRTSQASTAAAIAEIQGTVERTVERLFEHDYPELLRLLKNEFGIKRLSDLL
jgi:hypothetical protein